MNQDKLQVEAINNGSVIDHIPARLGFRLLTLFRLTETDQRVTIGLNLPTSEGRTKDLIKIENTFLTADQINQLAIYAPNATINKIENFKVVAKLRPTLPDEIKAALVCPNANCISHNEPVNSRFAVKTRRNDLYLRCHYCEKEFSRQAVIGHW
ncbi:aspartate carbamoyltransferase regulatory subunit [Rosenbergiella australiborealis]|uniref:Aspartate carbamoyltransferase regulatory chain n=1 Tax=Rosenbergiella australiborealis TaxID=1544696 RepID=A0ABS5T146_9GAMM|nr:aspartate carbamoyltransferase regulatory subunit [Rosenbergiella australiborealis]MBT0725892.1 aspartate carbamoyltransferase regulatory subunit [Rosenbergiella australiborealis]